MDRFDPFVKYSDIYGDVVNWEKDPMNKPQNQNKYFFSDGKTYYEQICKMLKLMSVFKDAFNQIYDNEDEISSAWENFVNNLSATAIYGEEPSVELTWTETSVNFAFTIPGGEDGVGIASITFNSDYTMTINLTNGQSYTSDSLRGPQGQTGPQGPQGEQGIQGPRGENGTNFQIKGLYPTLSDLKTAHPTGNLGDAYAVGTATSNVVYNWDVDHLEWKDIGSLRGPQGPQGEQGIQGQQGEQGNQGPPGPGVPQGGTTGQALVKSSNNDYDTEWKTIMNVPSTYTTNHLAMLNSSGQLEDSGKSLADLQELLTAGNGINISNNNVIKADTNVLMSLVSAPTSNDILLTNGSGQAIDSGMQFATLNRKVKHGLDFSQVLFFGDSFVEGWTPNGTVTTWCTRLANMFSPGFNYQRFYAGGAGFAHASSSNGHTFETYWDSIVNQINTNTTTIFIMGGCNDKDITNLTTLQNAINSFVAKIRETFPSTQTKIVYIFNPCCQIPLSSLITTCNYYMHYNRAIVFSDSYWWNLFRTSFYSTDYLHPNENGHFQIARIIYGKLHGAEYLNNATVDILSGSNQLQLIANNNIVNMKLLYTKEASARSVKIADFPNWLSISWNSNTRKGPYYNYRELMPCADTDGSNLAYLYFGGGSSAIYVNSLANIKSPSSWSSGLCYFNKSYDALMLLG